MHRLKCYNMSFNLAIKQRDTCIRNIYLKCYIFREILGASFIFSYIINQKRNMFVNHCPSPFYHFHENYVHVFIQRILCGMGVLVQGGNDAAETKKNLNASRCRYHICTEINRSLDN